MSQGRIPNGEGQGCGGAEPEATPQEPEEPMRKKRGGKGKKVCHDPELYVPCRGRRRKKVFVLSSAYASATL